MALEQLRAFREGQPLESLGPVRRVGPDEYPLLESSELSDEHERLGRVLLVERVQRGTTIALRDLTAVEGLINGDPAARTRLYLALLERTFAFDAKLSRDSGQLYSFFDYGPAADLMGMLLAAGVHEESVVEPTLEWFNCYRFFHYGTKPLAAVVDWVRRRYPNGTDLPASLRQKLIAVHCQLSDVAYPLSEGVGAALQAILGEGPWELLAPCEVWAEAATRDLEAVPPWEQEAWNALLWHCRVATSARPTAKWLRSARVLVEAVGSGSLRAALLRWLPLVDAGRHRPMVGLSWENNDDRQRVHEGNAVVLRGLLWLTPQVTTSELVRAVAKTAMSAYRKIRGIGPRAVKVGNAAVYALSEMRSADAVGQLALLKVRVKFGTAQKEIEKAFNTAAEALGLPRDQIEEMGVPTYGLEEVGLRRETFASGEYTAELRVDGREVGLTWTRADGKPQKSVPAKVKSEHKEELKELQTAAKDIAAMLPAQSERLDSMFLLDKHWAVPVWRERYLDHPLVGTLARRLIWTFNGQPGIWLDGQLIDQDDRPIDVPDDAEVRLWHPIGRPMDEVLAWRAWLERHRVRQPFKQAHREVYLLTDAERRTNTYSNRFAAHIIRQHQFHALCAARGWRNKLRLMVDDVYPPATKELPTFGLRAEFWVEGIGDDYGTDTAESGAYLRLSTDQVRFYRTGAAQNTAHAGGGGYTTDAAGPGQGDINQPIALELVPPLAFSEVMRDVDLFVGVASVGNDPTWQDGGPGGRFRTYWQSFSFGELNETANTRRAVLERLVPRLKIASRATLTDRFLVVRGQLRTYKIHLGSGNILMEPNDQYLCIVPDRSSRSAGAGGDVFLPFEGDATLAVILSKAFLLADDQKIMDPTIVRQIKTAPSVLQ